MLDSVRPVIQSKFGLNSSEIETIVQHIKETLVADYIGSADKFFQQKDDDLNYKFAKVIHFEVQSVMDERMKDLMLDAEK